MNSQSGNILSELFNDLEINHHFYIFEGEGEKITFSLREILEEKFRENFRTNFQIFDYDKILIDDSKNIAEFIYRKNSSDEKTFFIISCNSINLEAQNSFLKICEEPPTSTHLFLILPRHDIVLDTLKSRAVILKFGQDNILEESREILKMNLGERINWVSKFVKKISDEKIEKREARKIIENLISILREFGDQKVLKNLIKIDDYIKDSGASVKNLLEKAMIEIPVRTD